MGDLGHIAAGFSAAHLRGLGILDTDATLPIPKYARARTVVVDLTAVYADPKTPETRTAFLAAGDDVIARLEYRPAVGPDSPLAFYDGLGRGVQVRLDEGDPSSYTKLISDAAGLFPDATGW